MLVDTWTGGGSSPALYCRVDNKKGSSGVFNNRKGRGATGFGWVEKAFLEGKLPQSEVLAYQSIVRKLPERYESDPKNND